MIFINLTKLKIKFYSQNLIFEYFKNGYNFIKFNYFSILHIFNYYNI